ncbi:MAG: hypothetical protein P4L74_04735 [Candidatus Doudnabacteria bacterium]|nr:hypothetical protein [Candidatus Doudnabacteria bacterium]
MSKFDTGLGPEQIGRIQKTDLRIELDRTLFRRLGGLLAKEGITFDQAAVIALEKFANELEAKQKMKREDEK